MSTYTYTYAYTRAEAIVDQVDTLFSEAGIDESRRNPVCDGVNQRWLEAVGLFLERDDKRVYEIEASINWTAHTEHAELSLSTDLPGWEEKGSPEAIIESLSIVVDEISRSGGDGPGVLLDFGALVTPFL